MSSALIDTVIEGFQALDGWTPANGPETAPVLRDLGSIPIALAEALSTQAQHLAETGADNGEHLTSMADSVADRLNSAGEELSETYQAWLKEHSFWFSDDGELVTVPPFVQAACDGIHLIDAWNMESGQQCDEVLADLPRVPLLLARIFQNIAERLDDAGGDATGTMYSVLSGVSGVFTAAGEGLTDAHQAWHEAHGFWFT
jgi:DNA-binding ferritin-like protein